MKSLALFWSFSCILHIALTVDLPVLNIPFFFLTDTTLFSHTELLAFHSFYEQLFYKAYRQLLLLPLSLNSTTMFLLCFSYLRPPSSSHVHETSSMKHICKLGTHFSASLISFTFLTSCGLFFFFFQFAAFHYFSYSPLYLLS